MKHRKSYRFTIEDRSRLVTVAKADVSAVSLVLTVLAACVVGLLLAGIIIMATPLRTLLPGYMKTSERAASYGHLMMLDSLASRAALNESYLSDLLEVTDVKRGADTAALAASPAPDIAPDSILPPSPRERDFVRVMQEKEKYHLSVLAPLAADAIDFAAVSPRSVISAETLSHEEATVVLARGEAVASVADGVVLGVFFSPAEGGNVIVVQHDHGFASRYAHLGKPLVQSGDQVEAGQIIALSPEASPFRSDFIRLRLWHDGLAVIPAQYLVNN